MKTTRFIIAFIILLAPLSSVRAQDARGLPPGAPPALPQPTSVPQLPEAIPPNTCCRARDERPVFSHQGVLVEKLDCQVVREQSASDRFNPASPSSWRRRWGLRNFGAPRFATTLWIRAASTRSTGTVTGDLVVSGGANPSFHDEHAVAIVVAS